MKVEAGTPRPLRTVLRITASLSLLFAVCTPFVDVPEVAANRWGFLFGGIGYSALLAFVVVGWSLLPEPHPGRLALRVPVLLLLAVGALLYLWHDIQTDPLDAAASERRKFAIEIAFTLLLTVLWVFLVVAGMGWYCHFTRSRRAHPDSATEGKR